MSVYRAKRQKPIEEGSWDCSVCTFQNPAEAYKCEMCDVRKGTSTRYFIANESRDIRIKNLEETINLALCFGFRFIVDILYNLSLGL